MVLSHRAKFQRIINFLRVKAIFTGLIITVLQKNFGKCFTAEQNATLDANSLMLQHFTYDSVTTETEDSIDLQSDFGMKTLLKRHHILSFGCTY